ncbi:MAG: hypothetical protein R3F14_44950 [Polyangiaceae bacterium]
MTVLAAPHRFDVFGDDVAALMLPDIARCHDWGYDTCLDDRPVSTAGELLRLHMLADWFIHFGEGTTRERSGWAYRKMGVYAREYDAFFASAAARGLREGPPGDSRRGFSHTMMEYSIDTWLIRNGHFEGRFRSVQDVLGRVGRGSGLVSVDWARRTLAVAGARSDSPDLAADALSFGERVLSSRGPEELVYRAGVKKFGLQDSDASVELMKATLDEGLARIPDAELRLVVQEAAEFLSRRLA